MKTAKILLITSEICCILGVLMLAFHEATDHYFEATLEVMFAMSAIIIQSEQQKIPWDNEKA